MSFLLHAHSTSTWAENRRVSSPPPLCRSAGNAQRSLVEHSGAFAERFAHAGGRFAGYGCFRVPCTTAEAATDAQSALSQEATLHHSNCRGPARSILGGRGPKPSGPIAIRAARNIADEDAPGTNSLPPHKRRGRCTRSAPPPTPLNRSSADYLLRFLPVGCFTLAVALPNTESTVT